MNVLYVVDIDLVRAVGGDFKQLRGGAGVEFVTGFGLRRLDRVGDVPQCGSAECRRGLKHSEIKNVYFGNFTTNL